MNPIQVLEDMIYETRKAEILQITWGGSDKIPVSTLIKQLEKALERIKSLPPSISQEDIDKLQRYDTAKPTDFIDTTPIIYESDTGEYVRYDSLIQLLNANAS